MRLNDFAPVNQEIENDNTVFFNEAMTPEASRAGILDSQARDQAAIVALMNGGDIESDFNQVYQNLIKTGVDPDVEAYRQEAATEKQEVTTMVTDGVVEDSSLSKVAKLDILGEVIKDEGNAPSLRDTFIDRTAEGATTVSRIEDRSHSNLIDSLDDIQKAEAEIERIKGEFVGTFEADTLSAVADFGASAIIPGFGVKLKWIVDQVMPEDGPAWENIAPGEALVRFKETMKAARPDDKVEMAKRLVEAINDANGIVWENDFDKYTFVTELLDDLNPTDASIQTDRWLNNAFGVLDVIPFATTALRGYRAVSKTVRRGSTVGTLAETAPNDADAVIRAAIADDSDKMVEALGTTREAIISLYGMPKPALEQSLRVGPDMELAAKPIADTPAALQANTKAFTGEEVLNAASKVEARLDEVASLNGVVQLSKTQVEQVPGGVKARTTVAPSAGYGWATPKEAIDSVGGYLEVQEGATVRLLQRDYKKGEYVEVDAETLGGNTPGEYIAQVDITHQLGADDVLPGSFADAVPGVSGRAAAYMNKSGSFAKWIVEAGNIAGDQRAAVKGELLRTMKPFFDAGQKGQARILALLDKGDAWVNPETGVHEGKWFSRDELITEFNGDRKLIDGYLSVRNHQDKVYDIQNARLRKKLQGEGYRTVVNEGSGYTSVARPLQRDQVEPGDLRVYDTDSDNIVELTGDQIDSLYANGGQLMRLPSTEQLGDDLYDMIVQFPNSTTKAVNLPANVLKKRDGYITRVYDTAYVVKVLERGVKRNGKLVEPPSGATFNGKPLRPGDHLRTVKMASNSGQATRAVRGLQSNAEEGVEYGFVRARELADMEYGANMSYESFRDTGQLFFSKRGTEISSVSGDRTLADIADSIEVARNNAARHAGMDVIVDSMTARWEAKFGKQFGDAEGKFPVRGTILKKDDMASDKDMQDAVALRDHINMLAGVDTTTIARANKQLFVWMSEKIAGTGEGLMASLRENVAEALLKGKDRTLLDHMKSVAFLKYIVFNPFRQLLLQPQQASVMLGIDYGMRYFASGRGVRDWTGLTAGLGLRDNKALWKKMLPSLARGMKMSEREFTDMVDIFRKTGLPDSIDSHSFVSAMTLDPRSSVADGLVRTGWKQAANTAKTVTRFMRKIGFDAGEYANISYAWLAVRNKWIKENPGLDWRSKTAVDDITAKARAMTLNMTSTGVLQQQKGLLGFIFQFMSHTTKSMQMLLPEKALGKTVGKFADKTFSGREKFRIFMSQLGLYGVGGFGAISAYNSFRDNLQADIPQEVNNAVEEGMLGWALQTGFHLAFDEEGEDTKLSFSTSFGPFSGTPTATPIQKVAGAIVDVAMMNAPDTRMLTPAGLSAMHGIYDSLEMANFIVTGVDLPESEPGKWLAAAERALTVAPMYDNALKARIANRVGAFSTKSGNLTVMATGGEIAAKAMFGIRSKKEVEISDTLRGLQGTKAEVIEGESLDITRLAKTYADNVNRVFQQIGVEGPLAKNQAYEALSPHIDAIQLGLNEAEFYTFKKALVRLIFKDTTVTKETKLTKKLVQMFAKGEDIGGDLANKVKHMQDFEGKGSLVKWLSNIQANPVNFTQEDK